MRAGLLIGAGLAVALLLAALAGLEEATERPSAGNELHTEVPHPGLPSVVEHDPDGVAASPRLSR